VKGFFSLVLLLPLPALAQLEYDCMIEARQAIEVRSPVEAVIEQVKVRRGDAVTRGQILVELAAGPERAALALARSRAGATGETAPSSCSSRTSSRPTRATSRSPSCSSPPRSWAARARTRR
jgi:multidrug efflux pump subunit AcrA (membrane-fusion protein)